MDSSIIIPGFASEPWSVGNGREHRLLNSFSGLVVPEAKTTQQKKHMTLLSDLHVAGFNQFPTDVEKAAGNLPREPDPPDPQRVRLACEGGPPRWSSIRAVALRHGMVELCGQVGMTQ